MTAAVLTSALTWPLLRLAGDVPVDPDAPTARDWLRRELAKNEYQAAKPTFLDRLSQQFWDWLDSLTVPATPGGPPVGLVGIVLIVVVIVVIALLVWGAPRLGRRSRVSATGELFGEDDDRTAAQLRAAAERAARAGDWPTAVAEQFRALARGLAERTVLAVLPGSTSGLVADGAARVFPAQAERLHAGARAFDGVRYLGEPGSREAYDELRALDRALQSATPLLDAAPRPELLPR
jgi:hypothetical protein